MIFKWYYTNHFGLEKTTDPKNMKLPKYKWKEPTQIEILENTDKISNLNLFIYSWQRPRCLK